MVNTKFNFSQIKNRNVHSYYDEEGVVVLNIIESGWKNKYDCILEWGEYNDVEIHIYTAKQIQEHYGISTFLRKEKLIKINESLL